MSDKRVSIHWFRKGLRLHDNPGLLESIKRSSNMIYPVYIMEEKNYKNVGPLPFNFLLQCLEDVDQSLRSLGSRLYVIKPSKKEDDISSCQEELSKLITKWNVDLLTFEKDIEPLGCQRDDLVLKMLKEEFTHVECSVHHSHTLRDLDEYMNKNKNIVPSSMGSFQKLFSSCSKISSVVAAPTLEMMPTDQSNALDLDNIQYNIPKASDYGYIANIKIDNTDNTDNTNISSSSQNNNNKLKFPGGEKEALKRMKATVTDRAAWTASFEKPMTAPNSLEPSTTVLSPYLKHGCLSPKLFYHEIAEIYKKHSKHSHPPVSLHGQLLWREFYYLHGYKIKNFDKMIDNVNCRQIPWNRDSKTILAWKEGRTGYPFIDAIMNQLRQEGWIHHLARHAVACFLTRGDLWQHWEEGQSVFEYYLLDGDWSLNAGNWQWLSCSQFFYQYFRCYSPVAFGKKTDKNGNYIRKYIPALKYYPEKYIFEPWKAPIAMQKQWGCVVGTDYPERIVIHEDISKINMNKMKLAYDLHKLNAEKGQTTKNKSSSSSSSMPPAKKSKSA